MTDRESSLRPAFRVAHEALGARSLTFCDLSVEGLAHLGRV